MFYLGQRSHCEVQSMISHCLWKGTYFCFHHFKFIIFRNNLNQKERWERRYESVSIWVKPDKSHGLTESIKILLCCVISMMKILTDLTFRKQYLFKKGALTWGLMGREVWRGIRRLRSVSDAEWHTAPFQSASSKQASCCCFYPCRPSTDAYSELLPPKSFHHLSQRIPKKK